MQPPTKPSASSVRVQIVLFQQEPEEVVRLVDGLLAAVAVARSEGTLDRTELAIGDCSPTRCLSADAEEGILSTASQNGFTAATYHFFDENLGSAGGSNRLAEGADTDFILVLNPDTYPSPTMLHRQISAFRRDVGAVEARQLPLEHPKDYDPITHDVSWASGACTMYRRDVFEAVGGFDTDFFFLHCDDVDLSWRIRLAGYRVTIEPTALALHHKPINLESTVVAPRAERYFGVLGKLMLARRYGATNVEQSAIRWVRQHGDNAQNDAVDEFERRLDAGSVPDEIEKAHRVADFVGSEYAHHRF